MQCRQHELLHHNVEFTLYQLNSGLLSNALQYSLERVADGPAVAGGGDDVGALDKYVKAVQLGSWAVAW